MSYSVNEKNNKITLTRGDTFRCSISLDVNGEAYEPEEGDAFRFALRKTYDNDYTSEPLLMVDIPTDSMILTIQPEDTKPLHFGDYVYDIQVTFANGDVSTFIQGVFTIKEEVY